jgi:hypothetical protein
MADDGIDDTNELGTELGTAEDSTITADGSEAMVKNELDLNVETYVNETITGDLHDDGTATVAGIETKTEAGTDVICELGTVKAAEEGNELGTFDQATTANPVFDKITT